MYATHFKLNGRLFAPGIAQDDAWFVDERDADAGLPAAVALSAPDSVLVLVGPPGVGKTAYAAQALRASAGVMRCAIAWIATPPASPHELLELLLAEFGFEPYRQSRAERVQTWRQFLIELGATETRAFIALERAHDFDPAILSALDVLTTADPNACPGASLVLMGTEELAGRLDEPSLEPLRQRVRLVRRLRPLDAAGVDGYLRHAAARAGGALEQLFTADALAALVLHSAGLPRLVNHLAEAALAVAALRGVDIVDGVIVSSVAAARSGGAVAAEESRIAHPADESRVTAATPAPEARSPSPAPDPLPVASSVDIPVLTESVDGEQHGDALDALDAAATMTLLGDDLDEIGAEIAAEVLAVDASHAVVDAGIASMKPADAGEAGADHGAAEAARAPGRQRRRASG